MLRDEDRVPMSPGMCVCVYVFDCSRTLSVSCQAVVVDSLESGIEWSLDVVKWSDGGGGGGGGGGDP